MTEEIKTNRGGKRKKAGRKPKEQKKDCSIAFRLEKWQKLAIQSKAKKSDLSVSEFVLKQCVI